MATKMTRSSRTELTKSLRKRYLAATIKQKQTILKEFIAATGYHPKSAVRVLNAPVETKIPRSRHRRPPYSASTNRDQKRGTGSLAEAHSGDRAN